MTKSDGKTFTYDMTKQSERDKYDPVMVKDSKTGEVSFESKDGTIKYMRGTRTIDSTRMGEATDARTLIGSQHPIEQLYADYANSMKALANRARMEYVKTGNLEYNKNAAKIYAAEVSSLESKLNDAKKNNPKERMAGRLAAAEVKRKQQADPELKGEDLRKVSQRAITKYREEVGSVSRSKRNINITEREWEAIQSGAISDNRLRIILNNSDPDILRQRAMPKTGRQPTKAQVMRMKALSNSNFTLKEIALKMNLSVSTVSKYLKGGN